MSHQLIWRRQDFFTSTAASPQGPIRNGLASLLGAVMSFIFRFSLRQRRTAGLKWGNACVLESPTIVWNAMGFCVFTSNWLLITLVSSWLYIQNHQEMIPLWPNIPINLKWLVFSDEMHWSEENLCVMFFHLVVGSITQKESVLFNRLINIFFLNMNHLPPNATIS